MTKKSNFRYIGASLGIARDARRLRDNILQGLVRRGGGDRKIEVARGMQENSSAPT